MGLKNYKASSLIKLHRSNPSIPLVSRDQINNPNSKFSVFIQHQDEQL